MEPRIAGSVSTNATDTQESPQGTGLVTAGITPQLFPGPILLAERRATAFFFYYSKFIVNECSRVETVFTLID